MNTELMEKAIELIGSGEGDSAILEMIEDQLTGGYSCGRHVLSLSKNELVYHYDEAECRGGDDPEATGEASIVYTERVDSYYSFPESFKFSSSNSKKEEDEEEVSGSWVAPEDGELRSTDWTILILKGETVKDATSSFISEETSNRLEEKKEEIIRSINESIQSNYY